MIDFKQSWVIYQRWLPGGRNNMQKWSVLVAWAFVDKCVLVLFFLPAVNAQRCRLPAKYPALLGESSGQRQAFAGE